MLPTESLKCSPHVYVGCQVLIHHNKQLLKHITAKMPYVFVGKRNFYIGKTLWEILGNLKDFGVGRLVTRTKFERYAEPTYFKIVHAEPLMDEKNLYGRVWAERVFRGKPFPEIIEISRVSYKNDFKLVPRFEEEKYTKWSGTVPETKKLPAYIPFPPLLKEMIKEEQIASGQEVGGEPKLKAVYNTTNYHNSVVVENLNDPSFGAPVRETTRTPRLYANLVTK